MRRHAFLARHRHRGSGGIEMDLLLSEQQRRAALAGGLGLHPEHAVIEFGRRRKDLRVTQWIITPAVDQLLPARGRLVQPDAAARVRDPRSRSMAVRLRPLRRRLPDALVQDRREARVSLAA